MTNLPAALRIGAFVAALLSGVATASAQGYPPPPPGSAPMAPPAPQAEIVPAPPPGPVAVIWQPGHWRWNGYQYVWVPGRYVRPPRPHAIWIEGHWAPRHGVWVWVPGHWR